MTAVQRKQEVLDINEYRLRRKRAGSAKWILMIVLLVVCLFAGYFFARSGLFTITKVEIEGNHMVTDERICTLTGYQKGEHLFSVDTDKAETYLLVEPYISAAEVKRVWPGTVRITVEERTPVARLQVGAAFVEVDATGKVLQRYTLVEDADLPLITGLDLRGQGAMPGGIIVSDALDDALAMLQDIPADCAPIGEINCADTQDIRIYTMHGMEVRVGSSDGFAEKCILFTNILSDLEKNSHGNVQYLDVSIPDKPVIR